MASGWLWVSRGLALACLVLLAATRADAADLSHQVAVVYNEQFPGSKALAEYYATQRGIPRDQLLGLNCAQKETISRSAYDQDILQPISDWLSKRGFWQMAQGGVRSSRIRYIVLMRGIPLRISSARPPAEKGEKRDPIKDRDEAAVDSELTLLGMNAPIDGLLANPYYRSFTPYVNSNMPPGMMLVCRLDGPDDMTVRRMIDDAILAETRGLWGWSYVDMRGIKSGGYAIGDTWIRNAGVDMMKHGLPVIFDGGERTFPAGFPMTNIAVYYGWYTGSVNGPFRSGDAVFVPGAIAVHIHSYSAATVRSATSNWAGPLLARGAAVSMGNVFEPYLGPTTNLDILQSRLMAGFNLADSAYSATPTLSWMTVILGDPLYRPYAIWNDLTLANARTAGGAWAAYREVVLKHDRDVVLAGLALRELARRTSNSMPLEALGWALLWQKKNTEALEAFTAASKLATDPDERFRLEYIIMSLTASEGDSKKALASARQLLTTPLSKSRIALIESFANSLLPKPTPTPAP